MTLQELEELRKDLHAVREAVERHSPVFRRIAASDFLARLSIPYGIFIIAFGIGTQILLRGGNDYSILPGWWFPALWVFVLLVVVVGGVFKLRFLSRRAADVAPGVALGEIYAAIWSGTPVRLNLPLALAAVATSVFAALVGHPWQILSATTVWFGLMLLVMAAVVLRREYTLSGWYGVAAGLVSLFAVDAAPWLLFAATWGGMLLVFGIAGVVPAEKTPAATGGGTEGRA